MNQMSYDLALAHIADRHREADRTRATRRWASEVRAERKAGRAALRYAAPGMRLLTTLRPQPRVD